MDILETGVCKEVESLSTALAEFRVWLEGKARLEKLLNEQAAKLSAREKELNERHAQQIAAADSLQDRETKVSNREQATSSLQRLLSEERIKIKGYQDREKHLDGKIDKLQKEKGTANATIAELQVIIKGLKAAIAEPTPAVLERLADVAQV